MATIKTSIDHQKNLTINIIKGDLDLRDISEHFTDYYRGKVTSNVIWDLTGADLDNFPSEDVRCLAKIGRKFSDQRKGGKTALVTPHDLAFALGRMFMVFVEMENFPVGVKIFHKRDKAMQWIFEG
ncbi:MAG: hypothetical protein HF978_12685 [Desulfobacteraceae bacterium]|nr:hypothetical protein [Desulfobacteraceae bacterium]MBC2756395.1 hypothetical protein [Desulfobacteraceae bacterium]